VKSGDLVRFKGSLLRRDPWRVGLLMEYHKWEKIATILYKDEILRVAARDVQKFGRRYSEATNEDR
jgi:hypothetical protein